MSRNNKEKVPSRRSVLKSAGVGLSSFVALTGTGSAAESTITEEQAAKLEAPHGSATDAKATIEQHGDELLTALSDAGILPAATVSELDVESLLTKQEHAEGKEGLFSSVTTLGQPTSRVTLRKHVEDNVVKLFVHPEAGENYAVVHSKDSYDDATIVSEKDLDGTAYDGSIGTEADYVGYSCEVYVYSDCTYDQYPWFVDDSGCYKGERWGCCIDENYKPRPC